MSTKTAAKTKKVQWTLQSPIGAFLGRGVAANATEAKEQARLKLLGLGRARASVTFVDVWV